MNRLNQPFDILHSVLAHAEYKGFSDITYERSIFEKTSTTTSRRPYPDEIIVKYLFPQMWPSGALGHGGMGTASTTTAYTTVLACKRTQEYLVYFGHGFAYKVHRDDEGFQKFIEDCKSQSLVRTRDCGIYVKEKEN